MTPEQSAALREPFPASAIGKLPKGGVQLDFVGHAAVTARLLLVDPAWDWEPFAVDADGFPAYQNGCLWIRLTICGVTRIGVGDGPDPKQRIGDAIRNAAMRFGVALDLWSRQELEGIDPNGGDAAAKVTTVAQFHAKHPLEETSIVVVEDPRAATPGSPSSPGGDQIESLREAVAKAILLPKTDAIIALGRINVHAAKSRLMTSDSGVNDQTVAVFLDNALKMQSSR